MAFVSPLYLKSLMICLSVCLPRGADEYKTLVHFHIKALFSYALQKIIGQSEHTFLHVHHVASHVFTDDPTISCECVWMFSNQLTPPEDLSSWKTSCFCCCRLNIAHLLLGYLYSSAYMPGSAHCCRGSNAVIRHGLTHWLCSHIHLSQSADKVRVTLSKCVKGTLKSATVWDTRSLRGR